MNTLNEAKSKNSLIIRIENANMFSIGDITKITGNISGKSAVSVINSLDLEANPRSSKSTAVTDAIHESIVRTPTLFPFKSKGLLLAFSDYDTLERSRYRFYVDNPKLEGILDGGHNALAIGLHTLEKAFAFCDEKPLDRINLKKIKIWSQFKDVWNDSKDIIEKYLEYLKSNPDVSDLNYYIPAEIIVPRDPQAFECVSNFTNSLFEICYARNNNAQLAGTDKANHKGFYDPLRCFMDKKNPDLARRVSWKSNEGGDIKAQDIVALSLIPLNLLMPIPDVLGKEIEPIAPQKLYSAKGSSLQHFERIMESPKVTKINESDSKHELLNDEISSALEITADIPELYDYIYEHFPDAYNKSGGSYGRITVVKNMNKNKRHRVTPYMKKEIDTLSPEGYIMPLVYGLQTLMEIEVANGNRKIVWKQNPKIFLEENLSKIVEQYSYIISASNFDPQKVGKAAQAYQIVLAAYKYVLSGSI